MRRKEWWAVLDEKDWKPNEKSWRFFLFSSTKMLGEKTEMVSKIFKLVSRQYGCLEDVQLWLFGFLSPIFSYILLFYCFCNITFSVFHFLFWSIISSEQKPQTSIIIKLLVYNLQTNLPKNMISEGFFKFMKEPLWAFQGDSLEQILQDNPIQYLFINFYLFSDRCAEEHICACQLQATYASLFYIDWNEQT